jgi:hypothetical protein
VIGSYHELWNIEKSFRMSKSDLQARPVYHRKRDSIEAHLIRKFVKSARRYRTVEIQAGRQIITAADLLPDELRQALDAINRDH